MIQDLLRLKLDLNLMSSASQAPAIGPDMLPRKGSTSTMAMQVRCNAPDIVRSLAFPQPERVSRIVKRSDSLKSFGICCSAIQGILVWITDGISNSSSFLSYFIPMSWGSTLRHIKLYKVPCSFLLSSMAAYGGAAPYRSREGLTTRPVSGSDEIQLRIDPMHADLDDEITGLRSQVRKLRNVAEEIGTEARFQNDFIDQLQMTLIKAQAGVKSNVRRLNKSIVQYGSNNVVHVVLLRFSVSFGLPLVQNFQTMKIS
ncbi:hypothetical protein FNV43_RR11157 [Rhamnella rubrinervis]|uniref:t-SNARE coiled-coil homology domain-containing protein n=1 Tax=Rhamnella rubrinervis TaxID=2594499 RepID=A0A8K0H5L4_9ROSA|nr:hypothetical protein FNV43_RR11157 [Rhamnella rubrinervis]